MKVLQLCCQLQKLDSSAMIQYIGQIRQAIRFAVADLKGAYELPGFSIPKKVQYTFLCIDLYVSAYCNQQLGKMSICYWPLDSVIVIICVF